MTYRSLLSIDVNISMTSLIRIYIYNSRFHLFLQHRSCSYGRLQMGSGPSQGISLPVEGGCDVGVNSTFLRQTQASPWRIYSTSLLFSPAGPLLHKNETTAFMTDWERTEGASCCDEGVLFTLGCCQTTAKFITSLQSPLRQSHLVKLTDSKTKILQNRVFYV